MSSGDPLHTVFQVTTLCDSSRLKFLDSVLSAGNSVLVAQRSSSALKRFEWAGDQSGNPDDPPMGVIRESELGSALNPICKKEVTQLAVVEAHQLIVVLADEQVKVLQLPSLQVVTTFEKSKGANAFAVYRPSDFISSAPPTDPQPALSGSRQQSSSAFLAAAQSSSVGAAPLLIAISVKKKLLIYQWSPIESRFRESREVNLNSTPVSLLFAGQDTVFLAYPERYCTLSISSAANEVELFSPGKKKQPLMCVLPDGEIMLVRDEIGITVDWNGKPTRSKPSIDFQDSPTAAGVCFPYLIVVLSKGIAVRSLLTTKLNQLLNIKNITAVYSRPDTLILASGSALYRLDVEPLPVQVEELVASQEFEEALSLVPVITDKRYQALKEMKICEIRAKHGYFLFQKGEYELAMQQLQQSGSNPRHILALFPDILPSTSTALAVSSFNADSHNLQRIPESQLMRALSAIIPFLMHLKSRLERSVESQTPENSAAHNSESSSFSSYMSQSVPFSVREKELDAAKSLSESLELLALVDTMLLKAYLLTDERLVMPFLSQPNRAYIDDAVSLLRSYDKYPEMIALFKSRSRHRDALQLLSQLSTVIGTMNGPDYIMQYLQELNESSDSANASLILEYSKPLFATFPDSGLRVFTHCHASKSPGLIPPGRVLEHIRACNSDNSIAMAYLESLIHHGEEADSSFHDELVFMYLDAVISLLPTCTQSCLAGSEPGLLGIVRRKLLAFLESSVHYHTEKMLSRFPADELLQERAILLSRVGRHSQVLSLYVHRLNDPAQALRYCHQVYNEAFEEARQVYLSLLQVLLTPGEAQTVSPAMLDSAMSVLTQYHDRIDTAKALALLPADMPLSVLQPFVNAVLRGNTQTVRSSQVVKNLVRAENLQVNEDWFEARSHRVVIDSDTVCQRCFKRIGSAAFLVYSQPTRAVVHYHCSTDADKRKM